MALKPIPQHDGVERKRGSIDDLDRTYSVYSNSFSRAFNPVEYAAVTVQLEEELETAIENAREATSEKFLAFYRELLKHHCFKNHRVWISAAMGMASVRVTNLRTGVAVTPEHESWGNRGVYTLICEISQALNWDWAAYLDNKTLVGMEALT
jgi:hypothetical protein